jgi:hypothetical protein
MPHGEVEFIARGALDGMRDTKREERVTFGRDEEPAALDGGHAEPAGGLGLEGTYAAEAVVGGGAP